MLDPAVISGTPFNNRTAYLDVSGTLLLMHRVIAETIARDFTVAVRLMPLGQPNITDKAFLQALQAQHADECRALAIAPPPDLQSYDLRDEAQFAAWTFALSNDLARIKSAAGV